MSPDRRDAVAGGRSGSLWVRQDQASPFEVPWLPTGTTVVVPGRGEFFIRRHQHPDPTAPMLMLLHGWTASADLQYFTAYRALAERYSFVAIDHRGHGRGLRSPEVYRLEDAADDAAAVVRALGVGPVIAVGYSMGGPISLLMARRHREVVSGLVVQATALEWRARLGDRLSWMWLPVLGAILRSWAYPRYLHRAIERVIPPGHVLAPYLDWITAEMRRGDAKNLIEAGRALKFYDARGWADSLRLPAGMLVTRRDRLVRVPKQRALATALGARIVEIDADHLCTMAVPEDYCRAVVDVIDGVVAEIARAQSRPAG